MHAVFCEFKKSIFLDFSSVFKVSNDCCNKSKNNTMHSTEQTFLHKMHIDTSQFDVIMIEKKKKKKSSTQNKF